MTSKFVRVTAQHIIRDGSDPMPMLQFDIKISDETKRAMGKWAIFGILGSYKNQSEGIHPIILMDDGNIDFGTEWDEERFGETNIREKPIEQGTYFDFKDGDGEKYIYAIKTIAVLGGK